MALKKFKTDNNKVVEIDKIDNKIIVNSYNISKNNKLKNSTHMQNIEAIEELIFLIPSAKKTFNYLEQAFIKVSIL